VKRHIEEVHSMRRATGLMAIGLVGLLTIPVGVDAQTGRRQGGPLVVRVPPRSFLNPGTVVPVGSLNRTTSGYAQTQSYLLSPPYAPNRERFGLGVLPDPITNGPFVGARNPFSPIDYVAPPGLMR
jgi:hypothetical protein